MVHLEMDTETIKKYVHCCFRPMCGSVDTYVIQHVANAKEFANAVKREWLAQKST